MTPGIRRLSFVFGAISIVLIVLPAVHEFGHYLPGVVLGAEVRDVTWTLLSGHAPRVYFHSVSGEAMPWVDAGGVLIPTFFGLVLIALWARYCSRPQSTFWLLLLLSGICLSCKALGPALAAFSSLASYSHLRGLAQISGLHSPAAIGFQLFPLLFVLPTFYYVLTRFRALIAAEKLVS